MKKPLYDRSRPQKTNKNDATLLRILQNTHKLVLAVSVGVFAFAIGFTAYDLDTRLVLQKAALIADQTFADPLSTQLQCAESNQVPLKVVGGSGNFEWKFIGESIDGEFGVITDGINAVNSANEVLTTNNLQQIVYVAPKTSDIQSLGVIQVEVTDLVLLKDDGTPQSQTFTLNIRPSCVKDIEFDSPSANEIINVTRGFPVTIDRVKAILFNGDQVFYKLPNPRIGLGVTPEDAGVIEGGQLFISDLTSGEASLFAFVEGADTATPLQQQSVSGPLNLSFASQQCALTADIFEGRGGGFGSADIDKVPLAADPFLFSGDNKVIFVEDGREKFIFSSSDPSIVAVIPFDDVLEFAEQDLRIEDLLLLSEEDLLALQNSEVDLDTLIPQSRPSVTEFAVLVGINSGEATVFVTDRTGCTAFLKVLVDIFPPKIEFARFLGNEGVAKGATEVLQLRVTDLNSIEDIFRIELELIEGKFDSPDDIPEDARRFAIIDQERDIISEIVELDENGEPIVSEPQGIPDSEVFTRLYEVPVFIPEFAELVDGDYTVLVTVSDKQITSSGFQEAKTVVPLRVGSGLSGDFTNDGRVDVTDVIKALRVLTGQEQSNQAISLLEIIELLRKVNQ